MMKLRDQGGAVLITALLLLMTLTLLSLAAMDSTILQNKMSYHIRHKTQSLALAETALLEIEQQLLADESLNCEHPWQSSAYYLQQTAAWWQSSVNCSGNVAGEMYYYFFTPVAQLDCLYAKQYDVVVSAEVYRIMVWATVENTPMTTILEANAIRPIAPITELICEAIKPMPPKGLLTWWQLR